MLCAIRNRLTTEAGSGRAPVASRDQESCFEFFDSLMNPQRAELGRGFSWKESIEPYKYVASIHCCDQAAGEAGAWQRMKYFQMDCRMAATCFRLLACTNEVLCHAITSATSLRYTFRSCSISRAFRRGGIRPFGAQPTPPAGLQAGPLACTCGNCAAPRTAGTTEG